MDIVAEPWELCLLSLLSFVLYVLMSISAKRISWVLLNTHVMVHTPVLYRGVFYTLGYSGNPYPKWRVTLPSKGGKVFGG